MAHTLVEWLVGKQLTVKDYEFHAQRFFCQPSKRTLALAEKVLMRLECKFADELEAWCIEQEKREPIGQNVPVEWL